VGSITSDGNPYVMSGDIYCNNCIFEEGVDITVAPGGYKIMYSETFTVNGTEQNPVIIKSISGSNSSWGGITNQGDASNNYLTSYQDVNINYLELYDASTGFDIATNGGGSSGTPVNSVIISNSKFSNCGLGISFKNAASSQGVTSSLKINNSVFFSNSVAGMYICDNVIADITNNTITNNYNGINITHYGTSWNLNSNIIASNSGFGLCRSFLTNSNAVDIECTNSASYTDYWVDSDQIKYNNFFNNDNFSFNTDEMPLEDISGSNLNGDPSDQMLNIYLDPLLNEDYTLQSNSPCIDAGDFLLPYDEDGTIADIGAYPFGSSINDDIYGCTYSNASNFNSDATIDDGSCQFLTGDINQDGLINILDIVTLVTLVLNAIF